MRVNWTHPCDTWANNAGVLSWKQIYYTSMAGENRVLMALGAYANATNFSLATVSAGLDLFAFPIYACWLGTWTVPIPAGATTADQNVVIAPSGREFDLREPMDNFTYNPDTGLDRRTILTVGPQLPVDPARDRSLLRLGWLRRVANASDSELGANWDRRFVRNGVVTLTGADTGWSTGLVVFGLQLNPKINDLEFTNFQLGFMASTGTKMGSADRRYYTGVDTEVVSRTLPSVNSRWTDSQLDLRPLDRCPGANCGPTNYAALVIVMRGAFIEEKVDQHDHIAGSFSNPGLVISVAHMGPVDSTTYYVGGTGHQIAVNEFLNMPVAVSPAPEGYNYPGDPWSSYVGDGERSAVNRNSELERNENVASGHVIQTESGRKYFEFSNPTAMAITNRRGHTWRLTVGEAGTLPGGTEKWSAKRPVRDTDGYINASNQFLDNDATSAARFQSQGVTANDRLRIVECGKAGACTVRDYTVLSVLSETHLTITTAWNVADQGAFYRRYYIFRHAGVGTGSGTLADKVGECAIDQWYGGGPGGYPCVLNNFWQAQGPVIGTSNIRVHVPVWTPGAATLGGVTGVIPDLWDGLDSTGANRKHRTLEWAVSISAMNTAAAASGGLGRAFDWNNQDFIVVDTKPGINSQDGFVATTQ